MGHSHSHNHAETGNIKVAFFLNLGFTLIEIVGGFFTNSIAILSDALHDMGDTLSLGMSWYFQRLAGRDHDHKYSYGYHRFSVLGALINGFVLLAGSIYIVAESIPRFIHPEATNKEGMMGLAVLGIVVNGIAALRMRKGSSLNEQVVSLHLLEDVLGWVGILIGSILMKFYDWPWLDPLMSLGLAVFILSNVYKNLKQVFQVILQGTPKDVNMIELETYLKSLPGVQEFHDLHVWSMDGEFNILSVHLVRPHVDDAEFKQQVREGLSKLHVHHATLELEAPGENCDFYSA
jgi:cobalt-zinc-cadmium efflux system protein